MMDAYALLGVEHAANPGEIRQAYKRLAREHHPDRHPASSPEQQAATERMTAINAAYQLVRDAPLRHHRVSTGARPDDPWTDAELEAAIRAARHDRTISNIISASAALIFLFLPWFFSGWIWGPGGFSSPLTLFVAIVYVMFAVFIATSAGRGPGRLEMFDRLWNLIWVFRFLTRY